MTTSREIARRLSADGVLWETVVVDEDGGGGGAAPTTREEWSGNGVAFAAPSTFEWLTWDSSGGPDAILDNTDPAHPVIVTPAGVYLVSVVVEGVGDISGYADVGLWLDRSGFNASQVVRTFPVVAGIVAGAFASTCIAFAWYLPTGAKVEVGVDYTTAGALDDPGSLSISTAHLQRLS